MKIALCSSSFPVRKIEDVLDFAVNNGFNAIEIDLEPPYSNPDYLIHANNLKSIRRTIGMYNIDVSVHMPISSVNIASGNDGIRGESIRQLKKSIDVLHELGGRVIVVHNGIPDFDKDYIIEICSDLNLNSLRELSEYAYKKDVILGIENIGFLNKFLFNSFEDMQFLFKQLNYFNIGLTFDIAHACIAGETEKYIRSFGDLITHVHISNNDLKEDLHLPICKGRIKYKNEIISFLKKFNGIIAMEIFSSFSKKELLSSKRFLEKIHEEH